ncbi:MAG: DUF1330 domain-containing protein [SAR324 cluster bacterium]|jgi:uncharacterized protein (DUF1330 family)|nr:DUF1330 domain-containing protein [SAR324 cluster bacterium]MDP7126265.1 DUF1330 domain-containing protein [Candidatus Neomarinimicrobiota bacterium]
MAKAYVVAVYSKIIDPEKLKNYIQDSRCVMGAHGAKALAIGSNISNISKLEGIPPERAVIMEFEDVEAAQKAFQSNLVNEEKLEGGVDRVMFVLEGV